MVKKIINIIKEFDVMDGNFLLLKIGLAFVGFYYVGYGVGKFVFYILH